MQANAVILFRLKWSGLSDINWNRQAISGRENLSAQLAPTWILDVNIFHPTVFKPELGNGLSYWAARFPMPYTYPKIKPEETKNYLTMLIIRAFTSG